MDDDGSRNIHLCCCEYIDIDGERNHLLGCCCNCVELDLCVDRLLKSREMWWRSVGRVGSGLRDRLRVPWRGGARQVSPGSVAPVLMLPALGYVAAQGVWLSVVVFTSLPLFLVYTHYLLMRAASQSKFLYMWTLVSLVLIVTVFEGPVVVTLDIRPEEHALFIAFTLLTVCCAVKTRLMAEQSYVKGDMKLEGGCKECPVCHKNVTPRTFHCRICRTCVIKRDQHCAWLDCCIGECNYRWYMGALVTAVCQLTLCCNLVLTTACHPFTLFANIMLPDDCSDVYFDILYATMFVTALYALLAAVFVGVVLAHECWLISLGMTGHEWRNLSITRNLCCGLRATRPYSKGLLRNWLNFFLGVPSRQVSALTI